MNISDDILVYCKTQEDHDRSLNATLQRLKERNLTLNKAKLVCVQQIQFRVFWIQVLRRRYLSRS